MAEKTTLSAPCTVVRFPSAEPFGSDHRLYPHAVQFYLSENFLLGILSDFIVGALKGGDGVVIIATKAHREGLVKRLRRRGIEAGDLRRKGKYVELDALETMAEFMVRGMPEFERFSEVIGRAITGAKDASEAADPRVMVFGELVALLLARRRVKFALMVEQFWGRLVNAGSFSLLCAYPIQEFEAAGTENSFLRICAQHLTVSPPEAYASPESEERILRATARAYADASLAEKLQSPPSSS
jgi:hypothetical protein